MMATWQHRGPQARARARRRAKLALERADTWLHRKVAAANMFGECRVTYERWTAAELAIPPDLPARAASDEPLTDLVEHVIDYSVEQHRLSAPGVE